MKLLTAAALFHIGIALLLFGAGSAQVAPKIVNRAGVVEAADPDAIEYCDQAEALAVTLRERGLRAWAAQSAPIHVRTISLCFLMLAPLFGYSTVAAEPFNLVCYLSVLVVVFAIGRELSGVRVGRIAAVIVALWPTFVLHTVQFLKDPPFIAGSLVLVLIVVTWLTRDYTQGHAILAGAVAILATSALLVIRSKFAIFVVALVLLALALLVVRQLRERRLLRWNLICAVAILAVAGVLLSRSTRTLEKVKLVPSPVHGPAKSAATGRIRIASAVAWMPAAPNGPFQRAAMTIGIIRARYNFSNAASGSGIDSGVELHNAHDFFVYLPRALAIGLWAPFPSMWFGEGYIVGTAGRLASGVEMLAIYACELLAFGAVILGRRRVPAFLLLLIATSGVVALALVVSNLGTLYRFRYTFWILFIVTAVSGAEDVWVLWTSRHRRGVAICVAILAFSCARPVADANQIVITNASGVRIDAIYLSASSAPSWEENILSGDLLRDGESVGIHVSRHAPVGRWDMRIDGGGSFAEWTRLDLSNVSAIRIRLNKKIAVAELDPVTK
jgi:hypothetical protein